MKPATARGLPAIAMFLGIVGCAHYQPAPIPAEPSLAAFEARTLADAGLKAFVQERARGNAPSLWNLQTLSLAAFYYHPDIEVAHARWAVVDAGKITAGQRPNPSVSLGTGYDSVSNIPTPWIAAASFDVPIETAGKRTKRVAQAHHLSEAARFRIAVSAWDVRARLRKAFLDLWAALESETVINSQKSAQEDLVRLLEVRHGAGDVGLSEVTRERIALEQSRVALLDAQNRSTTARVDLSKAVGIPARALDGIAFSFDEFSRPPRQLPGERARRSALLNRADVLAGLAEYAAAEAALHLEIAKQYPDVHLNPGYDFDQGDSEWKLGLTVALPLLNQNEGPIAEAEARRREQAAKFIAVQANAIGAVDAALAGYHTARSKLATSAQALELLDEQKARADALFEAGEVPLQSVASAQLERATVAMTALKATLEAQQALGDLETALQLPSDLALPAISP
jgi:outer membrane protein, heavy metal efflux system